MIRHRLLATSALALPLSFGSLSAHAADIVETLKNSQQYSTFAEAIEKAGLSQTLQGDGPYTVFAPTDEAFQNMMSQPSGQQSQARTSGQSGQQTATSQSGQSQGSSGQSNQQQAAAGQSGQQQQAGGGQSQLIQQLDSAQLKQVLSQHIIEGQELAADDLLGKEQKVSTLSGDELTVDGTGRMVVLVPTGLSIAHVGDEVFVRREVTAATAPAVTVSPTTGQQGQQSSQSQSGQQQAASGQSSQSQSSSGQSGQQQAATQSGSSQQSQSGEQQQTAAQSGGGQQSQSSQQQAAAQSGSGQGQSGQNGQPIEQQQGMLRAAMVVEPGMEADNGVIHGIDQVLVSEEMEKQLTGGQSQQAGQQSSQ